MSGMSGSAHVVGHARGHRFPPVWELDRSVSVRLPAFAQALEDPARAFGLTILGDSTGALQRWPYQFLNLLAPLIPTVKIVYHLADYINNNPWFAAFGSSQTNSSLVLNAASWAAAGGQDPYMPLPGTAGISMVLPPSGRRCPPNGTKGFVSADCAMNTWLPASNMVILAQNDASLTTGRGTTLRIGTDGRIGFITSPDGVNVLSAVQSSVPVNTIPGFVDGQRINIGVLFDLSTGTSGAERSYTFMYRLDAESAWTQLGAVVTAAGASTWYGSPRVGWEFGAGGSSGKFAGKFYGDRVALIDEKGPDLLPRLAQQWDPTTPNLTGTMVGGPVLHIVNSSWPQHGLHQFTPRDDTTVPGTSVFTRGYGYMESAMPLLPQTAVIVNTGHNENYVGQRNARDWRRLMQGISRRYPEAEVGILIQNPTLRDDGPAGNIYAQKRDHDRRNVQAAALARTLGAVSLDGRQAMLDYVRGGGSQSEIMQPDGQKVHPNATGALIQAKAILEQIMFTPFQPGLTP